MEDITQEMELMTLHNDPEASILFQANLELGDQTAGAPKKRNSNNG